jgi:hypothetical protein
VALTDVSKPINAEELSAAIDGVSKAAGLRRAS